MKLESIEEIVRDLESFGLIPKYGWKAKFDREPVVKCKPFTNQRFSQIKKMFKILFRPSIGNIVKRSCHRGFRVCRLKLESESKRNKMESYYFHWKVCSKLEYERSISLKKLDTISLVVGFGNPMFRIKSFSCSEVLLDSISNHGHIVCNDYVGDHHFILTAKFYIKKRLIQRKLPFIDPLTHVPWKPIYGVPMGGIGCGSIGRGFKGEFCRSSLIPGMYCYDIQTADHFIVTIRKDDQTIHQQVLLPVKKLSSDMKCFHDWNWDLNPEDAYYVGLYPRSWTVYNLKEFNLVLLCKQISPVIPHNYQDSCLPVCVFEWKIFNWNDYPLEVTITFTWHGPEPRKRYKMNHLTELHDSNASDSIQSNYHPNRETMNSENSSSTSTIYKPCLIISKHSLHQKSYKFTSELKCETDKIESCFLNRVVGNELSCCFGIGAKSTPEVKVNKHSGFLYHPRRKLVNGQVNSTQSIPTATQFWTNLKNNEQSSMSEFQSDLCYTVEHSQKLPKLAIAISSTCIVPSFSAETSRPGLGDMEFALIWHSPIVRFRDTKTIYKRRYTRWFPRSDVYGAKQLMEYAFENWRSWNDSIEGWQNPVLNNRNYPDWYKSAIFNELYYLTDGGSVWLDPYQFESTVLDNSDPNISSLDLIRSNQTHIDLDPYNLTGRHIYSACNNAERLLSESWKHRVHISKEMGFFGYLEGHEYRMYNTHDVHYEASWALIKLWPKLQLALNYDCADLTIAHDSTPVYFIYHGKRFNKSSECAVPHDFGDPEAEPWFSPNAYNMSPTDLWKDLNSKFILQVWRDWTITKDQQYLIYMLPIMIRIFHKTLLTWDGDNDGLIENSSFPDQTFDCWKAEGLSAYTGGLWLASLHALHDMVEKILLVNVVEPNEDFTDFIKVETYRSWTDLSEHLTSLLDKAKTAYAKKLWTGSHFAYDLASKDGHQVVMAAQLSGYSFARITGMSDDSFLAKECVHQCLKTICERNWLGIEDGQLGVINGTLPGPKIYTNNPHAEEFWVGVNYSIAATLIAEGMVDKGFSLAEKCYDTIYNRFGLQYQTPEAYMTDGRFRCPGYMRPLAIWSMQHILELKTE